MNEFQTFLSHAAAITALAKERGCKLLLYRGKSGKYFSSTHIWDDWLFKVYPGGRKEFSVIGKELVESWGVNLNEVTRKVA
jgi:hypothetical protein